MAKKESGNSIGYWINPLTGEINRETTFSNPIQKAFTLPHRDQKGNYILVLIDKEFNAHVIGPEELFQQHLNSTFFYFTYPEERKIVGYTILKQVRITKS